MKISEKYRKKSEKYRHLSGKIGKSREKSDKRNFCAVFFSRLTEKRYFGEISTEKTEIFVHGDEVLLASVRYLYCCLWEVWYCAFWSFCT